MGMPYQCFAATEADGRCEIDYPTQAKIGLKWATFRAHQKPRKAASRAALQGYLK